MNLFAELMGSVLEADEILKGKRSPSREALVPTITFKQAKDFMDKIGMSISEHGDEYSVTFMEGTYEYREDSAYYTDNLKEAVFMGQYMRNYKNRNYRHG